MEERLSFKAEDLNALLDFMNDKKDKTFYDNLPNKKLNQNNISIQEAKLIIRDRILNDSKFIGEFDLNDVIDLNYFECPNCGEKMYYFPIFQKFMCPSCLYKTEELRLEKSYSRVRKENNDE